MSQQVQAEFLIQQLHSGEEGAPWEQAAAFLGRAAAQLRRQEARGAGRDKAPRRVAEKICEQLRHAAANRSSAGAAGVPRPAVLGALVGALASYAEAVAGNGPAACSTRSLSSAAPPMLDAMAGYVTRQLRTPEACVQAAADDLEGGVQLARALGRLNHRSVAVAPLLSALCRAVCLRGPGAETGTLCALLEAHLLQGLQPSPTALYALAPVLAAALEGSDDGDRQRLLVMLALFPDVPARRLEALVITGARAS